jgi:nucleoside-diphosphate-sugar epimerase
MKIFVTGGTGFIGSHFLNQAAEAGHKIVALRRSPQAGSRISLATAPQWVNSSMEDIRPEHLEGCAAVVHLAAHSANVPYDTLENCLCGNVLVPLRMFEQALRAGVKRFIVAGSCFEYGSSGERYEFIPADAPLEPTLSYPASKAAATVAFHAFAHENKICLLNLRIFQVFGEGELESRLWPSLRRAALAGQNYPMTLGEQVRDFIPVEQVAAAFVRALDRSDLEPGQPKLENLGTGQPQSLRTFAEHWWKVWNAKGKLLPGALPYRNNEVMRYVPLIPSA